MCVRVSEREREREGVCLCERKSALLTGHRCCVAICGVRAREGERKKERERAEEREREDARERKRERERERASERTRERERERERERGREEKRERERETTAPPPILHATRDLQDL